MKKTLLTVGAFVLAAVVLYAMAGFLIAPRILERELRTTFREQANLDFAAGAIAVNPFTLALSLHNVTLFRPESTPVVSLEAAHGRIAAVGPDGLALRDVVLTSLQLSGAADDDGLEVPRATAGSLGLGGDPAALSFTAARFERPTLRLVRDSAGTLEWPQAFSYLATLPSAFRDNDATLDIAGGRIVLTDRARATPLRLEIAEIRGTISRSPLGMAARAALKGRTEGGGTAELDGEWLPDRPLGQTRLVLALDDFDLAGISPYVSALVGRGVRGGRMDLDVEVDSDESMLELDLRIALERARFGTGPGVAGLPLETAAALLEDAEGRIVVELRDIRRAGRGGGVVAVLPEALAAFLESLAVTPFEYLADLGGRPGADLGRISFAPGSAEVRPPAAEKLEVLKRVLQLRPRLGLTVFPGLNEVADREALARRQVLLHVNLASSAGLPGQPAPEALDYADPIVLSVLDEFAANRLPPATLAALRERHPDRGDGFYRAVFEALVDNETVAMPTLVRLARYRARSVIERLDTAAAGDRVREAPEIVLAAADDTDGAAGQAEVTLEARTAETRTAEPVAPSDRSPPSARPRR